MKEVSPKQAQEAMAADAAVIYLDVRSVPEFQAGHAERAINVPILHMSPGAGMQPNEDFIAVVEANVPKDATILVGCKSGGRSARAADIMSQLGYADVTNIRGGFHGAPGEPGWSVLNLPVCSDCSEEASYASLAAKAHPSA